MTNCRGGRPQRLRSDPPRERRPTRADAGHRRHVQRRESHHKACPAIVRCMRSGPDTRILFPTRKAAGAELMIYLGWTLPWLPLGIVSLGERFELWYVRDAVFMVLDEAGRHLPLPGFAQGGWLAVMIYLMALSLAIGLIWRILFRLRAATW